MAADISHIAQLLDATLDPQQHKKGKVHSHLVAIAPEEPLVRSFEASQSFAYRPVYTMLRSVLHGGTD